MRFSNEFGFCDLNEFPGCSQLIVSNHAFIYPEFRGKGMGDANHKKRLERIKALGYDAVICTVRTTNLPQIKILRKNNWSFLFQFQNRVNNESIEIWARKL